MNLFEALDTSPYVCILREKPEVAYGPYTPEQAMAFCDKWNKFFTDRDLPGTWVAINLVTKTP